jgi:hypothetical protein
MSLPERSIVSGLVISETTMSGCLALKVPSSGTSHSSASEANRLIEIRAVSRSDETLSAAISNRSSVSCKSR